MTVKLQGFYRLIEERAAEFAIFMAGFVPEATSRAVPFAAPDAERNYRYTGPCDRCDCVRLKNQIRNIKVNPSHARLEQESFGKSNRLPTRPPRSSASVCSNSIRS